MDTKTVMIGLVVMIVGILVYFIGSVSTLSIPVEQSWWIFKTSSTTTVQGNPYIMLLGIVITIIGVIVLVYGAVRTKKTK